MTRLAAARHLRDRAVRAGLATAFGVNWFLRIERLERDMDLAARSVSDGTARFRHEQQLLETETVMAAVVFLCTVASVVLAHMFGCWR